MNTLAEAFSSSGFQMLDFIILGIYVILIVSIGIFLNYRRDGQEKSATSYFLAGNTLTWWAVGASLVAANISAEQIIGMSGTAFAEGIATTAYEIMAAIVLVIIGKFLLPIMMEHKIFTIPQFLRERYNDGVGLAFAILWLFLYVFVNLTSVAWLGALAIEQLFNLQGIVIDLGFMQISTRMLLILSLFIISGFYSIYGGQANVAWTDVMQLVFIVGGGLITTWVVLQEIGIAFETSAFGALGNIYEEMMMADTGKEHMHLIIQQSRNPEAFSNVPGLAAIVGTVMLTNFGYWGFNQYIIQKGLAAQNIHEAQKGLLFAGFLKLLIPFFVVLPGICAYYIYHLHPEIIGSLNLVGTIDKSDHAYAWLIRNFTPAGIKGLAFVALLAAILSTLASILNSTATIFTMDIYKKYLNPSATDKVLVSAGRLVGLAALLIALFSCKPLLGDLDQGFKYIQENSSLIYPGIIVVVGFGLLWKRASGAAAVWTAIITIPLGLLMKAFMGEVPFMMRASYVFILECVFFITISLSSTKVRACRRPEANTAAIMRRWAYILGGTGLLVFAGSLAITLLKDTTPLTAYLNDIGIQSFIFFGVLVGCNATWLYSNANDQRTDAKALPTTLSLFHTTRGYSYATICIILITLLYYIFLW